MFLYRALFLAIISKTIANPLAYDLPAPDLGLFSPTASSLAENQDWIALSPADSESDVPADTESSASSDPRKETLDNFNLDIQNGLNIGFTPNPIAAVNTDISESECLSSIAQTSKSLRTRQKKTPICYPLDTTGSGNGNGKNENGNGGSAGQTQESEQSKVDTEDQTFIKEWDQISGNKNPDNVCQKPNDVRVIPVCCQGPESTWGPSLLSTQLLPTILIQDNCVEFIEGRPRCRDRLRRFCAEIFGAGLVYRHRAFNVRWMYS